MIDTIEVDYSFDDKPQLDVDYVEIPRSFTVGEFKNTIKYRYPSLDLNEYAVLYNAAIKPNSKKFSDFWLDNPVREIRFVRESFRSNRVTDTIVVDYEFTDDPQLGGDTVEIPRSFTIGEFKSLIKSEYKSLDFNEYHAIYNGSIQPNNKKFSNFWLDNPVRELIFVRDSLPTNPKADTIVVDYEFTDDPQLGGDTVEIPRSFTVGEFKNKIKSKYTRLNFNDYRVIYMKNNAALPNNARFSDFWSDYPVSEIHFVTYANSGLY